MQKIKLFWQEIIQFAEELGINIPFNESTILFGNHLEKPDSPANVLILWAKSFIWCNKFEYSHISLNGFKLKLKKRLTELKELLVFTDKENEFSKWNSLLDKVS